MTAAGWALFAGFGVLAAQLVTQSRGVSASRLRQLSKIQKTQQPRRWLAVTVPVGALAVVWACGVVASCVVSAVAAGGWIAVRRLRRARSREQLRAAVVELCRATAAELRAGRHVTDALAAAVRAAPPALAESLLPAVTIAQRADAAEQAAVMSTCAAGDGSAGLRKLAACWQVAAVSGAALAPAIDRVADALQDEIELGRDVTSALAGPRATVRVLAALPVVGLLLGTAIGARPLDFLLHTGPGVGCLLAAGALDIAGVAWAQRIARAPARLA